MKRIKIAALSFCLSLLSLPFVRSAHADEWDKKTNFTFNEPVDVPGVVLPAGSFVFKLADSDSDRNIVQTFSEDQKPVVFFLAALGSNPAWLLGLYTSRPFRTPSAFGAVQNPVSIK